MWSLPMIADLPLPQTPTDLALAYMFAVDRRDWATYRKLFTDEVEVHYEPNQPGVPKGKVAADDWVSGAEHTFDPIEATHHTVVPVSVSEDGNTALAICNCQARHFDTQVPGSATFDQFMVYTIHMTKDGGTWRIHRVDAEVLYSVGNPMILAKADQEKKSGG